MAIFRRETAVRYYIDRPIIRVQAQKSGLFIRVGLVRYWPPARDRSESVHILSDSRLEQDVDPCIEHQGDFTLIPAEFVHPDDLAELQQHYKETDIPFYHSLPDLDRALEPPELTLDRIYTREEIARRVLWLNAFFSPGWEWRAIQARKEHEDLFGEPISNGEYYYKRSYGAGWDAVVKLSQRSMERLVWAVFVGNFGLQEIAEKIGQTRQEKTQAEIRTVYEAIWKGWDESDQ